MHNPVKKVAAIHDLSGCGRVSLTVAIPILSAMGIQVCPLPTAVLSSHTQYPGFTFLDLTDQMPLFVDHWKQLDLKFDAIYSGFLGSSRQTAIVASLIDEFAGDGQLVVVDPVLGDNGKLYTSLDGEMIAQMRVLIRKAVVITPNLTELFMLIDKPYREQAPLDELKEYLVMLADHGPEIVIVTSVPEDRTAKTTSVVAYEKRSKRFWKVSCLYFPAHYPGTGDTFTSVITGSLMQGDSLPIALDRAVQFILMGIRATFGYEYDNRDGILLERILPTLQAPVQISSYELL
ncbi:MAG: pyridoxamine kinase [Bacteroidales bacterium]|jgi:pyridoxine kinase|nr:pyridoxamine kinase [Bacteroidales bacterium]